MTITFNCPACSAPLDADVDSLSVRCPYCQNSVIVPEELRQSGWRPSEAAPISSQTLSLDMDLSSLIGKASQLGEVVKLARSGEQVEAIRRYRQLTGASLKDSQEAIEALASGQAITLTGPEISGMLGNGGELAGLVNKSAALEQVQQLVKQGNKIEAIRLYRETFDTSLKESKTAVERIEAGEYETVQNMALQAAYIPQVIPPRAIDTTVKIGAAATGGLGCLFWFIGAVTVLSIVIPILIALASPGGPLRGFWLKINPTSFARLNRSFGGEGTGTGLFTDPRSVSVDGEGSIYVAEYSDGRIQRFTSSGELQNLWNIGNDTYVTGMAAQRDGTIYIVYRGEIVKYNGKTGAVLGQVDLEESHYFEDAAMGPDGKLVAVTRGENIMRFDPQGQADLSIPAAISSVSGDSELGTRLAVDGLGNIYALGIFNNSVFKFSPQGKFITRFGSSGDEPGQFRAPYSITVDGQSRVYVSDIKGIQVFDSQGRYLDQLATEGAIFGMTVTAENELVAVSNQPKVYIYKLP